MSFDWTITLGNLMTIGGIVVGMYVGATKILNRVDDRLMKLEQIFVSHTATLIAHAARMEKQDDMLLRLVGDVQRLIGHMESRDSHEHRRPAL